MNTAENERQIKPINSKQDSHFMLSGNSIQFYAYKQYLQSQYLFEIKRSIFVGFSIRFDPALNSADSEKTSAETSETALISAGFLNPFWNCAD